ncbi:MAG: PrsW family intramembrane metalloprotease [Deltaproteobacteria bacterium]|nr:PrsW family intramembrane metalloprotease [Deltaproteobacteria bacterium]
MSLILTLLSVVFAVAPMLAFVALVWWMDRYDREPVWLFALTFLWGAIGAVLLALLFNPLVSIPLEWLAPAAWKDAVGPVLVAPLVEEPAKALFLLFVLWNRHFDNMSDGFVYGAAAGLGFGMTENFLYFAQVGATGSMGAWLATVVIRTLYSAVMHATASSVVGAAMGWARFRGLLTLVPVALLGLGLAMGIHFLWNGLLTLDPLVSGEGRVAGANFFLFPMELLAVFAIFQVSLLDESLSIRRELREEAERGLIDAQTPGVVASWWARTLRSDWVPPGVPRRALLESLTALAKRKRQARLTGSEFHRDEVVRLRRKLERMLSPGGNTPP